MDKEPFQNFFCIQNSQAYQWPGQDWHEWCVDKCPDAAAGVPHRWSWNEPYPGAQHWLPLTPGAIKFVNVVVKKAADSKISV